MSRTPKDDSVKNDKKDHVKEYGIEKDAESPSNESEKKARDCSASHKLSTNKRRWIILSVIVTAVILCVVSGFLVYRSFRQDKPEEEEKPAISLITDEYVWSDEVDGATFYYEFKDDGAFIVTVGSIEYRSQYEEVENDGQMQLGVDLNIGSFRSKGTAGYADCSFADDAEAQTLSCSYDDETSFTLKRVKIERVQPEPEDGFSPVQPLLGTWNASQEDGSQQVVFHEDGTMEWSLTGGENGASATYSGSYTFEEDAVIFTYYAAEKTVVQLNYSIDGDQLNILGSVFVREGAETDL